MSAKHHNTIFAVYYEGKNGDCYNLTPKTAIKHIDQMIKLNLIKDALLPSEDDKPVYEVVDPRFCIWLEEES